MNDEVPTNTLKNLLLDCSIFPSNPIEVGNIDRICNEINSKSISSRILELTIIRKRFSNILEEMIIEGNIDTIEYRIHSICSRQVERALEQILLLIKKSGEDIEQVASHCP